MTGGKHSDEARGRLRLMLEFARAEQAGDPYGFRFAAQDYLLRSAGGGFQSAPFAWDAELLADLQALRQPGRDPEVMQRMGDRLRHFIERAGWGQKEAQIVQALREHRGVILTIRSAAAELYALPWELLTLTSSGQHLGELAEVLVRYEWPETHSAQPDVLPHPEGGRILFAWSAAGGAVPAGQHLEALVRACAAGYHAFDPQRDVVADASCRSLTEALEAADREGNPVAVLHLLCHGAALGTSFGLALFSDEEAGTPVVVDAGRLRQLLAPHGKTLRLITLAACDGSNPGALGSRLGSVAQTLHRAGLPAIVASQYPLSVSGSIALVGKLYGELLTVPTSLEQAFCAARAQLARDPERMDWASLQLYARSEDGDDSRPVVFRLYRGLLAFQAQHTRFFFGRDAERKQIRDKLERLRSDKKPRLLIVAGASGTGKSSIVLSGTIPDLVGSSSSPRASHRPKSAGVAEPGWEVAVLRPGADPRGALDAALRGRKDPTRRLLLVVDQFEEIFTHVEDAAVRREFAARLWQLAQADNGIHCILTIRVDYLGQCGEVLLDDDGLRLDRIAYEEAHRVFVAQMGPAELHAAITGPAEKAGLLVEPGLEARMIAEVEGEPGALPLLEYTLDLLWQRREGRLLSTKRYAELGGVVGALEGKANAVIDALGKAEQAQARRLFVHLVGIGEGGSTDTRRRIALAPLRPREPEQQATFDAVLQAFIDARLLVSSDERGQVMIEVAHEALIRKWERLRTWLEEDREKLVELAELERWLAPWRNYGTLLQGAQLGYAMRVLEKYEADVSSDGKRMIAESAAARQEAKEREARTQQRELALAKERAEEQTRSARRLRLFAVGLSVVLAAAIFAGGLAVRNSRKATSAEHLAERKAAESAENARIAQERLLSLYEDQGRQELLREDPMRALLYLNQAYLDGSKSAFVRSMLTAAAAVTIDRSLVVLRGHTQGVESAEWSPDGTRIVTASDDKTARIWDAETGRSLLLLNRHSDSVNLATYSHDGHRVLTVSDDKTAQIWDAETGQPILTLSGHTAGISFAVWSKDDARIVTASQDKSARLWDAKTGQSLLTFTGHTAQVVGVALSSDGTRVATASNDKTAGVWDARSGQLIFSFKEHGDRVRSVCFSPDDTRVVTASRDQTARIWDAKTGKLLFTLEGHASTVNTANFSADGAFVLTASNDKTARIWNARTGRLARTFPGHTGSVTDAALNHKGTRLVTASEDLTARVWANDNDHLLLQIAGHTDIVQSAVFSNDGTRILTASNDKTARLWDAKKGHALLVLTGHGDAVTAAVMSEDQTRIATASADQKIRLFDANGGQLLQTFAGHTGPVFSIAIDRKNTRLITGSADKTARIWDLKTGAQIKELSGHAAAVYGVAFEPQGTRVATAGADAIARVFDAESGRALHTLAGHKYAVYSVAWSPDGTRIATGGHEGTARIWDAQTGAALAILEGHSRALRSSAWSPDSTLLATASWDETVRLWEGKSGKPLFGFKPHDQPVRSAAFSPDGTRLLTASEDQSARVWLISETRTPQEIAKLIRCFVPLRFEDTDVVPATPDPAACPQSHSR